MLDQLADRREKLVEPAGQFGGFIFALYLQFVAQVAFTLGDGLQAGADLADGFDDDLGERRRDQPEDQHEHADDGRGEVGHAGGFGHDFTVFDQPDIAPAEAGRGPHVGHVAHAVDHHFRGALRGVGQMRIRRAQVLERLEAVGGVTRVYQHHAVFDQHHIAAFSQLDAFDQFGEVLQRHADHEYALGLAVVQQRPRGAHQCHVVFVVVVSGGAHGLAGAGHRGLVPRAGAWVVLGQLRVIRPFGVGAVFQADGEDRRRRVRGTKARETVDHSLRFGRHRLAGRVGGLVVFQRVHRRVYRVGGHLIDVLQCAVEELPDIAIDLADFTGAAIDELIHGLGARVHDRDHRHQAYRDKSDRDECQYQLIFYFHRDDHQRRGRPNRRFQSIKYGDSLFLLFRPDTGKSLGFFVHNTKCLLFCIQSVHIT
ncbi:hypothetical protein PS720_06357 [Pseudomonas fluorescens]|nr:hypothetical protein PS720_06357 [Pseudomonas fluorescens]